MLSVWKNITFFLASLLYAGKTVFASVFDKFFVFCVFFVKKKLNLQNYELY